MAGACARERPDQTLAARHMALAAMRVSASCLKHNSKWHKDAPKPHNSKHNSRTRQGHRCVWIVKGFQGFHLSAIIAKVLLAAVPVTG